MQFQNLVFKLLHFETTLSLASYELQNAFKPAELLRPRNQFQYMQKLMVSLFDSLSKDLPKIAIITSLALLVKRPC